MANRPDWLFNQAAGLPYFTGAGQLSVVLVTSRSGKKWIFPKGVIDPGDTAEITAEKEALEEAGVIGRVVGEPIGAYEQPKWGGVAKVRIYPLLCERLVDAWEERADRQRRVLSLADAAAIVHPPLQPALDALEQSLESGALPT